MHKTGEIRYLAPSCLWCWLLLFTIQSRPSSIIGS